jgi:hypothetical protein
MAQYSVTKNCPTPIPMQFSKVPSPMLIKFVRIPVTEADKNCLQTAQKTAPEAV